MKRSENDVGVAAVRERKREQENKEKLFVF